MSEKLKSSEQYLGHEKSQEEDQVSPEVHHSAVEHRAEVEVKELDVEKARKEIDKVHEPRRHNLNEAAQSAAKILRVPMPDFEPAIDTVTKTWKAIRANLSPSEKVFSKFVHNSVVSNASEFTAKTLARPYAILAGGLTSVVGSSVYLYYTHHLGYQYNYFVPILLFAFGLGIGLLVEIFYKSLTANRHN